MSRNLLRKLQRKNVKEKKKDEKDVFVRELVSKFHELLEEAINSEELKIEPKMLWSVVNNNWNSHITNRLNTLKAQNKKASFLNYRAAAHTSLKKINMKFNERKQKLESNNG